MSSKNVQEKHYSNCQTITPSDAEKYLSHDVLYLTISSKDGICLNFQSCDCNEVILCSDQAFLLAKHEKIECFDEDDGPGRISLYTIENYQPDYFDWKDTPPPNEIIRLKKIHYDDNGLLKEIKFLYADRYLYIFSSDENLIVTKSRNELFDDEWTDDQGFFEEDSILFE
ncbi:MAG: hypothetical protein IKN04_15845 [Clostridia bacterium]|nr:hypothetical protein [Clostridia bacterium]